MVKVRKPIKSTNVCDMNLLIQKGEEVIDWDDDDLVHSIIEEVDIAENSAKEIGLKVKEKIRDVSSTMGWDSVPTSFIREFVSNEILALGKRYRKKANKYNLIGLSPHELKAIIENTDGGENSNITANNPEAINFNIAEILLKRYLLQEVFSNEVASAHYSGTIHIHDAGHPRFYAFSKKMKFIFIFNEEELELSLEEIWDKVDSSEKQINETQYEKDISSLSILVKDRGDFVPLKRLVLSKEEKEMIDFVTSNGHFSVTCDHGCVVDRNGELLIVRADEVEKTDRFISCS